MKKNIVQYLLFSIIINIAIVFAIGYLTAGIIRIINYNRSSYIIDTIYLEQYLFLVNLFISFLVPFLYKIKTKKINYFFILLTFELGFILVYQIITEAFFYRWPEQVGDEAWFYEFYSTICIVAPPMIMISIAMYYNLVFMIKKLLPEKNDYEINHTHKHFLSLQKTLNTLKYILFSTIVNIAIVVAMECLIVNIIRIIDYSQSSYFIDAIDLEQYLLLVNLFISFLVPFLYKVKTKKINYFFILLIFELGFILVYQIITNVFFYRWPEQVGDKAWFQGFFFDIYIVAPQAIIISIAMYYNLVFMIKKILPK
jgi:hypothetical protein